MDPVEENIELPVPLETPVALFLSCLLSYGVKTYRGRGALELNDPQDSSGSSDASCPGRSRSRPDSTCCSALSAGGVGIKSRSLDG